MEFHSSLCPPGLDWMTPRQWALDLDGWASPLDLRVPVATLDLSPSSCRNSPRHLLLWPLLSGVHQEWPGLHEVRHTLHFCRGEGSALHAFLGSMEGQSTGTGPGFSGPDRTAD